MSRQKDQTNTPDLASDLPAATAALSAEDREDLFNAIKNKLQDLAGEHPDFLGTLSPSVRKRVDALKQIQRQHDEFEAKYFEERAALEAKYQNLYKPLYTKRHEIVNGLVEVEGVSHGSSVDQKTDQSAGEKGVPRFWLTAMKNNELLCEEITECDEDALQYLKDIKWSKLDDSKGFKLDFFFDPNPYFKNAVLTKTYYMISEDEHILEKATGTEIEWFPGKNMTQKILKKKPKKGSEDTKPITRTEDCISFFNFFKPPQVPEAGEEIDEETAELLQSQMEQDYSIGRSTVREKVIPHAVSWFTGEAAEVDEEETEDNNEEDEDDNDDEDDEENDEEDDSESEGEDKKDGKSTKGDESTNATGTVAG